MSKKQDKEGFRSKILDELKMHATPSVSNPLSSGELGGAKTSSASIEMEINEYRLKRLLSEENDPFRHESAVQRFLNQGMQSELRENVFDERA
jgi:hypothetical protein